MQDFSMRHLRAPVFSENDNAQVLERVYETLGLVDTPPEEEFDRFSRLVTQIMDVPVALVSFVQEDLDRQYFKSEIGLTGIWKERRQTPLSHSFCQIVKRENRPLIVSNAQQDIRVCENLAIPELGVRAYLGVPVHGPEDQPLGALCAIDAQRRNWTHAQTGVMIDLAACVTDLIKLRAMRHSTSR